MHRKHRYKRALAEQQPQETVRSSHDTATDDGETVRGSTSDGASPSPTPGQGLVWVLGLPISEEPQVLEALQASGGTMLYVLPSSDPPEAPAAGNRHSGDGPAAAAGERAHHWLVRAPKDTVVALLRSFASLSAVSRECVGGLGFASLTAVNRECGWVA
jgi:hypothetical protein